MRVLPAASNAVTSMVAKGPLNETGQEYGGEVCWQITVPLTAVFTSVTPTSSEAVEVTVWAPLASVDALFGEVMVTLGGVVSALGVATVTATGADMPTLPAVSCTFDWSLWPPALDCEVFQL